MQRAQKETNKMLRVIYAVAREHGISNEELHDAISIGFQKTSLKQLTARESMQLIHGMRGKQSRFAPDRRRAMNAHGRKDYNRDGQTEYLVNDRERKLLQEAATLRGWSDETLIQFVTRQLGKDTVRTMTEFNKVFWALKSMNRRDGLCK
jgi:hypothetical protein